MFPILAVSPGKFYKRVTEVTTIIKHQQWLTHKGNIHIMNNNKNTHSIEISVGSTDEYGNIDKIDIHMSIGLNELLTKKGLMKLHDMYFDTLKDFIAELEDIDGIYDHYGDKKS